jgi:hypothetical protein
MVASFLSIYDIISFSHYKYSHATIVKLFTNALALRTNVVNQAFQIENSKLPMVFKVAMFKKKKLLWKSQQNIFESIIMNN